MLAAAVLVLQTEPVAELDSQSKTLQTIYSWYSKDKLFVNRRYQRKLVWTLPEKQKLISSVLDQLPIPAVLLAERDHNRYEIIDGLQRLHTLMSFVERAFASESGLYFDVDRFLTAKERIVSLGIDDVDAGESLLPASHVAGFLDYPLPVSIMRGASEDQVDDVFARINTYGHRLSDQERRQAGMQGEFPQLVRELASELRGDVSRNILGLAEMPEISIDLPKTQHGYSVQADQVFWVSEGILNGGNLRDSLDEQCIADIIASIVGGAVLGRSKESLDDVYDSEHPESARIANALNVYGADRIRDEVKFCIQESQRIASAGSREKLRKVLFRGSSNNPFPNVFAVLVIALHESLIAGKKKIADYRAVKSSLRNLNDRFDTTRRSSVGEERRKNVGIIRGLIDGELVDGESDDVYTSPSTVDIDAMIRRSHVESSRTEFKQGIVSLGSERMVDAEFLKSLAKHVCALANCGPDGPGVLLIGVADKDADVRRVKELDKIDGKPVGQNTVVGVAREAAVLGISPEEYFGKIKASIQESALSEPLKGSVLASMDYNDYFGLGVVTIAVPAQTEVSYLEEEVFVREGDESVKVSAAPKVAAVANRFAVK